jgi:hypothetical protein
MGAGIPVSCRDSPQASSGSVGEGCRHLTMDLPYVDLASGRDGELPAALVGTGWNVRTFSHLVSADQWRVGSAARV